MYIYIYMYIYICICIHICIYVVYTAYDLPLTSANLVQYNESRDWISRLSCSPSYNILSVFKLQPLPLELLLFLLLLLCISNKIGNGQPKHGCHCKWSSRWWWQTLQTSRKLTTELLGLHWTLRCSELRIALNWAPIVYVYIYIYVYIYWHIYIYIYIWQFLSCFDEG